MLQKDKKLHVIAGAITSLLVFFLTVNVVYAVASAFIIGLFKEIYDYCFPEKHTVDFWDFLFTGLGGCLAIGILLLILPLL